MSKKTAVIIAWRQGEDDLPATIKSAGASAGRGAKIYPVEDKTGAGPAQTRHRGIVAAKQGGADVVCIVDSHMRFDGMVIRDMAAQVRKSGGLLCAKCYHNAECSFDSNHPSGATYYAGADIRYMGKDQNGKQALLWKWSSNGEPGPRDCIGGACYVFQVKWYYKVGQPLSALPAWGCDEEALSISAWLSGIQPEVFDGRVAHRWRPRPPWKQAQNPLWQSRAAMIHAVAADPADEKELMGWQDCPPFMSKNVERWRKALLNLPRKWSDWRREVCGINPRAAAPRPKRNTRPVANLSGVICPHCKVVHDPIKLPVTHTYPTSRAHKCPECGRNFVTMKPRAVA